MAFLPEGTPFLMTFGELPLVLREFIAEALTLGFTGELHGVIEGVWVGSWLWLGCERSMNASNDLPRLQKSLKSADFF